MATTYRTVLFIAFVIAAVLFLLFATMIGSREMTGSGLGGITWLWIPALLTLALAVLLGWLVSKNKE